MRRDLLMSSDQELLEPPGEQFAQLYDNLRMIAAAHLRRERTDHTLQTTALVHEAYLRLNKGDRASWKDRTHFLAVASRVMRQALVDHANRRNAAKRGGGAKRIALRDFAAHSRTVDLMELHEAINLLSERSERQARIVEMRFFGGMTIQEVATELQLSTTTVEDDWYGARAWLSRELSS